MNDLIITPDNFYKKHLVCADENSNACDPKTKILVCTKCEAGFCSLDNCMKIHKREDVTDVE